MGQKIPAIVSMLILWITHSRTIADSEVVTPPCSAHETITCGDNDIRFLNPYSYVFCSPKTSIYRNITSVHIDLRYHNSYCLYYGNPVNFGVTADGQGMWVVHMCSGTFWLCLDIDTQATTIGQPPVDTTIINTTDLDVDRETESITSAVLGNTTTPQSNTTTRATEAGVSQDSVFDNGTGNSSTNNHGSNHTGDEKTIGEWPTSGINWPNSIPDNTDLLSGPPVESSDDELSKVWMTMGIVVGGFLLLCMIITIVFLALHSDDNDEKALTSQRRTRTENVSTAMLVKQDSKETRPSVYDFIPINAFSELPDFGERCTELPDLPAYTTGFHNDESQYMELPNVERTAEHVRCSIHECDTEQTCFIADDMKQTENKCSVWTVNEIPECSNDEHGVHLDADKTSVHLYYRLYPETEYDHLMSMPKPSMADKSTYNRLYQVQRKDNSDISVETVAQRASD